MTPREVTARPRTSGKKSAHENARERLAKWLRGRSMVAMRGYSEADAILDALGLEQVGWKNPGGIYALRTARAAVEYHERIGSEPVYRLRPSGRYLTDCGGGGLCGSVGGMCDACMGVGA